MFGQFGIVKILRRFIGVLKLAIGSSYRKVQSTFLGRQGLFGVCRNSSGQGVVEYILILVVGVLIALGGIYQLNDAFRKWATNYFSDYLACIMETGELPAIGGGGVTRGECDNLYQEFTLEDGRPLIDSSGGGENGGGESGGGESGGGDGGGSDGGGGASEPGKDSASRYATRRPSRGGGSRFKSSGGPNDLGEDGDGAGGAGGRKKKIYTGSTDASIPAYALNGSKRRFKVKKGMGGEGGVYSDDEEGAENQEKSGSGSIKKSGFSKREKRGRIKIRKIAKKEELPPDEPITFGSFIRYLIIAGIVIALVIFIGGQALQLGKGME